MTEANSTGATIGAGLAGVMPRSGWASYTRIPALRSLAGYDVVAVANSNTDSSRAAAEALGAARHVVLPYQAPLALASGGADFGAIAGTGTAVGILIALGLLIWLAYRGWSILLLAPAAAILAAALAGEPLLAHWTQTFMASAAQFVMQFFPIFLLGALFGKLMEDSAR